MRSIVAIPTNGTSRPPAPYTSRFRRRIDAAPAGRYRTPRRASGISAMITRALKITLARIAEVGTNRGPTSAALAAAVAARADTLVASGSAARGAVPGDAVTASASGLDPHVSPANARLQVARVASARGADSATVRALLERHIEGRQLGVLGEPRVNVLRLNIALDAAFPLPATTPRADSTTHPESP